VNRALVALAALAVALALPRDARAVLDPSQSASDVQEAMREKGYPFCSAPREPLSRRALELCPHASEIQGCDGFAAACARIKEPRHVPSLGGPWAGLSSILGTVAQATVWLIVGALLIAIIVPIVRALGRLRREGKAEPAPRAPARADAPEPAPLPTTDEEALLHRAAQLAARGENAAALELYLAASLRALDKRGAVRLAPHRTNGEYVRACADPAARPGLRDIVREVDRVKFGGVLADANAVQRAAQRAFAIVRALPAALLALAMLSLTGCGGTAAGRAHRPGDDPAGLELFRDVLHRQGVRVEPLATSLATMPLPAADESSPAVLVDLERTPLDEDTSAHLVEWVESGGVLILAGSPADWPSAFRATPAIPQGHKITARTLISRGKTDGDTDDEASTDETPVYARAEQAGELASDRGVKFGGTAHPAAWFEDTTIYAAATAHGRGYLLGIASDELLTNAGLARPGNAAAMIAILSNADRQSFAVAEPDDGVAPPSTPLAAMMRAGMGVGMAHALLASIVLFLAAGVRLARPKPAAPPLRRAFSEHVEAVGALYARTRNAPHALAVYARFADERLRAYMPRQGTDVAAFLSSRARLPLDRCQRLWARASAARAGAPPQGDELAILKELAAVYSTATAQGT
jgi:hypothetical protein